MLLTIAAASLFAVSSTPAKNNEAALAANYWDDKVTKASAVDAGRRNEWQKIIVAVNKAQTVGPPLDDEIVNAVVKFNKPEYQDCRVDMENKQTRMRGNYVAVVIKFSGTKLGGDIFLDYRESTINWLESTDGYGSGTDLLKLFEAMARFLGENAITLVDGSTLFSEARAKGKTRRYDRRSL
jgi:hypothetical protein